MRVAQVQQGRAGQGRIRDKGRFGRGCGRDVTRGCKWRVLDQGSVTICTVELPIVPGTESGFLMLRLIERLIQLVPGARSNNIL